MPDTSGTFPMPYPNTGVVPDGPDAVRELAQRVDDTLTGQVASWRVANSTARAALTGMRAGDFAYQIDTDILYRYSGSAWLIHEDEVFGSIRRTSATPSVSSASYTKLSDNANWNVAGSERKGFAAYNDGWTVPVAGRYLITYSLVAGPAGLLAGIRVGSTSATLADLHGINTGANVQNIAAAAGAIEMPLAASDTVRLFGLGATGTPTLTASIGHFDIRLAQAQ